MTRCETCGRLLTVKEATENVNYSGETIHFCSAHCKDAWNETIRKVTVAH